MGLLTEAALRVLLKDEDLDALDEYRVAADVIVTPSAKAYLIDHRIDLIVGDKRIIKTPGHENRDKVNKGTSVKSAENRPAVSGGKADTPSDTRYHSIYGGSFDKKPEYMTTLRGSELVFKDHKIIRLRGKVDGFEASAMETQFWLRSKGARKASDDLGKVIDYVRKLMRSEVIKEDVPPMELFGMNEAEIHERSHKPQDFYGFGHFKPITIDDGETVLRLNILRTLSRELELCAYEAFRNSHGVPEREDIVQAYNRLSSALYVMMLRVKAKEYE